MKTRVHRQTTKDSRQCCRTWIQDGREWVFPRLAGTLICMALTVLVGRADVFADETASFKMLGVQFEEKKEVVVSLVATDAGDGNEHDYVVWQQPRLVAKDRPDILLRDLQETGLDPAVFGKHPNGKAIDAASLCVRAPSVIKICLPAHLVSGRELLTTAALDEETGREGSVQVDVVAGTLPCKSGLLPSEVTVTYSQVAELFSDHRNVTFSRPILIGENSAARTTLEFAMNEYRSLFPAALCYTQIVPVDELHTTKERP